MILPKLTVARLKAADIPAIIAINGDDETASAAAAAQSQLRLLFTVMSPSDLIRQAVCQESPRQWLIDLAMAAAVMRTALIGARTEANQLMTADALDRHRFDGATLRLLAQDENSRRALLTAAANFAVDKDLTQARMREAGMTPDEISSLLAQRGDGSSEQELRDKVAAITQRIDLLTAFIGDPLRQLDSLGTSLASEIRVLTEAMTGFDAQSAGGHATGNPAVGYLPAA